MNSEREVKMIGPAVINFEKSESGKILMDVEQVFLRDLINGLVRARNEKNYELDMSFRQGEISGIEKLTAIRREYKERYLRQKAKELSFNEEKEEKENG